MLDYLIVIVCLILNSYNQPDVGLSYSDLGCRAQPLDSAVIVEQSTGCGPDGLGLMFWKLMIRQSYM